MRGRALDQVLVKNLDVGNDMGGSTTQSRQRYLVAPACVPGHANGGRHLRRGLEGGHRIISEPTDQPWGHRTLFVRDPGGNVVEIYADL